MPCGSNVIQLLAVVGGEGVWLTHVDTCILHVDRNLNNDIQHKEESPLLWREGGQVMSSYEACAPRQGRSRPVRSGGGRGTCHGWCVFMEHLYSHINPHVLSIAGPTDSFIGPSQEAIKPNMDTQSTGHVCWRQKVLAGVAGLETSCSQVTTHTRYKTAQCGPLLGQQYQPLKL